MHVIHSVTHNMTWCNGCAMSSLSVDLVAASLLQMSQCADDLCAMNQYESLTATLKLQILTRICQRWHALGRFEMVVLFACLISPPAVLCITSAGAGSRHPDTSTITGKALFCRVVCDLQRRSRQPSNRIRSTSSGLLQHFLQRTGGGRAYILRLEFA